MKLLLTTIAAVLVVGCSKPAPPDLSIHRAAYEGNIEAVKQHAAAGTDVNADDGGGGTPLHLAAMEGHKKIVGLLIEAGADVNVKDGDGLTTPLHWASGKEIAELLIAAGADVNAKDKKDFTPLDGAKNKPEIADLLRKHGGKTAEELNGGEPVAEAAKPEPPTAQTRQILIHNAAGAGNIEAVQYYLNKGVDINAKDYKGWTALHHASWDLHKEAVELLINEGAQINVKIPSGEETPLDLIQSRNWSGVSESSKKQQLKKKEIVELLLKNGGKHGSIYGAARGGDLEAVKKFLDEGADINQRGHGGGGTPLHCASSWSNKKEVVELLIAKGADVNAKDDQGYYLETPLHKAAFWGNTEIIEFLIAKGADVNAKSSSNSTPLDKTYASGETETANLLRKHGGKTGEELKAEDK
jgi:ankyrin repeat protein